MTWIDFYLICFCVGGCFSLLALFGGTFHAPHFHLHVPHGHGGGGAHTGAAFNVGTLAAFLMWFGGAGFTVTYFETWWFVWGLTLAIVAGLIGAFLVFWFITRVLLRGDIPLDPADYGMVGVFGHVNSPVREGGGTGEMIYSQQGRRCAVPIRTEDGTALDKGAEVIVTRFERGIAYVQTFDELSEIEGEEQP